MTPARRLSYVAVIVLLAAALRLFAVVNLPPDFDEPIYLRAGQRYALALRAGDLGRLVNDTYHTEHPGLVKFAYAAALLMVPPAPELPVEQPLPEAMAEMFAEQTAEIAYTARLTSAIFGIANVLLVAAANPLAGLFVAIHSYTVKYTAQIYLEALPMLASTITVLAYIRARGRSNGWLWLSAVALGLTAAGKYVYCVAGIAVALDMIWGGVPQRALRRHVMRLLGWGGLALLVFYAANPFLWPNPVGRLAESIFAHVMFSQSAHVQESGLPFYQPFIWLFTSVPWHPAVIFVALDALTAALGVIGAWPMWQQARRGEGRGQRVILLWWLAGMAFLLLWSTKWPQYILIVVVPVSFCAAEGVRWLWSLIPAEVKASSERWSSG